MVLSPALDTQGVKETKTTAFGLFWTCTVSICATVNGSYPCCCESRSSRLHLFGSWPFSTGRILGHRMRDEQRQRRAHRCLLVSFFPDLAMQYLQRHFEGKVQTNSDVLRHRAWSVPYLYPSIYASQREVFGRR